MGIEVSVKFDLTFYYFSKNGPPPPSLHTHPQKGGGAHLFICEILKLGMVLVQSKALEPLQEAVILPDSLVD